MTLLSDAAGVKLRDAGHPLTSSTVETIVSRVGRVDSVQEITDGLVHHVSRIKGEYDTLVVKRRGTRCRRLPEAPMRPADLVVEVGALRRIAAARPGLVPDVIVVDRQHHTAVLQDVATAMTQLGDVFFTSATTDAVRTTLTTLTAELATVHRDAIGTALRDDGDKAFLRRNLHERVGYQGTPSTAALVDDLGGLNRCFVLGDVSPKNILLTADQIALVDLEHAHLGPRVFDPAFLLAHVTLHRLEIDSPEAAAALAEAAFAAYDRVFPLDPPAARLAGRLVAALAAYRLRNPVVPYHLNLLDVTREALAETALRATADSIATPASVARRLTTVAQRTRALR